ncbi:toprim domain-containing protein [Brevundimonas sp.]|uniref:toprim domain-containing protein n=1 Tax=Brevundimonas sp. TaxID=1871086 RepID=UPI0028AE68B8|nr:toprim domain-containing protein [Brevundimonas sp.]
MSLAGIVAALGGELHAGGSIAHVPAPGHSRADRSVSLLLDGDRVVVHGFGASDWREVRDYLRGLGLIDFEGRLTGRRLGPTTGGPAGRPAAPVRTAAAVALWEAARPLREGDLCHRHFQRRRIAGAVLSPALRRHPAAPVSVFLREGPTRPALLAAVHAPNGDLGAVEITYLEPDGRMAERLRLPRKTVGVIAPGSAVRLDRPAPALLVAEGVMTTLSAMARFGLPGWALLSAHNLSNWTPPAGVARIIIAADRGPAGEGAAARLSRRLRTAGLECLVRLPPASFGDWNDAAP